MLRNTCNALVRSRVYLQPIRMRQAQVMLQGVAVASSSSSSALRSTSQARFCSSGAPKKGVQADATPSPSPTPGSPTEESEAESPTNQEARKQAILDEKEAISKLSLYGKLKRYGPPAMFIYLVLHCAGFWFIFFLLLTGVPVGKFLSSILPESLTAENSEGKKMQLFGLPWAEIGLALVINKMLGPLQMLFTVSVTPRLAPILLSWGPTKTLVAWLSNFFAWFKRPARTL